MFYYTDQTEPKKWITGLSDLIRREQIELATYEILELEKQAKELFNIMEQLNDALRKLSKLVSPAEYQKQKRINSYRAIRGIIGAGKSRDSR